MLCIVFMEVSGGQLTKYISGRKNPFQQVAWWMDNVIYFLNSNAGCSTTSFKKYHAMYHAFEMMQWQPHGTVTDEYS